MANYVYNSVNVVGDRSELARFAYQLAQPNLVEGRENTEPFQFWNVVRPEPEIMDYYTGKIEKEYPADYHSWDLSAQMAYTMRHMGNDWYDWNVRNWGCKNEPYDVDFSDDIDTDSPRLHYYFTTPWSPPEEVFRRLAEQYPTLEFFIRSVEEQGWGVEYQLKNGVFSIVNQWEIPESHADWVAIGDEYGCCCQYNEPEDMYEDCPDYKPLDPATGKKECEHHFVPTSVSDGLGGWAVAYYSCVYCEEKKPLDTEVKA